MSNDSNQLLPPSWIWGNLGKDIGFYIFESVDLNNDGVKELIMSEQNPLSPNQRSIIIYENNLTTMKCTFDFENNDVPYDFQISQLDEDLALEILIVTNRSVIVIDGATCHVQSDQTYPLIITKQQTSVRAAGLGDVNNDGIINIVYSYYNDNKNTLFVSKWNDLDNYGYRYGFSGEKIIVESMGRASGDDIVIQSDVYTILNGDTLQTIQEIHEPITSDFYVGDINGDNSFELITLYEQNDIYKISAYNIETGNSFLNNSDYEVKALSIFDVNNDGADEIIFVDSGDLIILNENNNVINSVKDAQIWTNQIIIDDFTVEGELEIIWGERHLNRSNYLTGEILSTSLTQLGPYQIAGINDYLLNNKDYVAVSFANTRTFDFSENSGIAIINDVSGIQQPDPYIIKDFFEKITAVASGNIDTDPSIEVCYSTSFGFNSNITCSDIVSNNNKWSIQSSGEIVFLKIIDIDNDMAQDLVSMTQNNLSVYDASNGTLKWNSPNLDGTFIYEGFNGVNIIDGVIWVSYPNGDIRKLNIDTGEILESIDESSVTQIINNGTNILAVFENQGVGVLNTSDLSPESMIYSTTDELVFLEASQDNNFIFVVSEGSNIQSAFLISTNNTFPTIDIGRIIMYDAFINDKSQLYIATSHGVEKYDLDNLVPLFKNGFENL